MTKRITLTLIGGLLAFTAGIVTGASWDTTKKPSIAVEPAKTDVKAPPSDSEMTEPSNSEVLLGGVPSRIVADEMRLKNLRLRYEVEMRYRQIIDSSDPHVKIGATTFASWNITEAGLRFHFDACNIKGCADGAQEVTIPFTDLRPFLKETEVF